MKRWLAGVAVLVLSVVFLGGSVLAADKIRSGEYPDLKIGFTTRIFSRPFRFPWTMPR